MKYYADDYEDIWAVDKNGNTFVFHTRRKNLNLLQDSILCGVVFQRNMRKNAWLKFPQLKSAYRRSFLNGYSPSKSRASLLWGNL